MSFGNVDRARFKCVTKLFVPRGEGQQSGSPFRRLLRKVQHKMLSRTCLDRLLNRSISKDGRTEAVHGLLEQQQTLCLFGDLIGSEAWRKVRVCVTSNE